jgi:hypothetical protein
MTHTEIKETDHPIAVDVGIEERKIADSVFCGQSSAG